jgi:hypothetical protein
VGFYRQMIQSRLILLNPLEGGARGGLCESFSLGHTPSRRRSSNSADAPLPGLSRCSWPGPRALPGTQADP